MKNFCKIVMILCLLCTALCACGKLSAPQPPEGSGYPHSYPRR